MSSTGDCIAQAQAPIVSFLRPGAWFPCVACLHKASCIVTFADNTAEECFAELMRVFVEPEIGTTGFVLRTSNAEALSARIDFFTPHNWIDTMTMHFFQRYDGGCAARISSVSTGFLPASVPLSPLLNAFFFFVPFSDNGQNVMHINAIVTAFSRDLSGTGDFQWISRGSGG